MGVVSGDDRASTELPLVQLARSEARHYRQRAGIEGRHVAAHKGQTSNEAADRLAEGGRKRLIVPQRAAALISCAQPILPEPEQRSIALALWQEILDEVDHLRPFWLGKQSGETVGSRSASASPTNSSRQVSIVAVQETRYREQVTSGVLAAAADKAGRGCVELWIRQDIMGDYRSFHVLVAEPRLLLKGHTTAGVVQFRVVMCPTARAAKPRYSRGGAAPRRAHVRPLYRWWCPAIPTRALDRLRRWPLATMPRTGRTQLARNSMRCFWNGTFVCQRRHQARTTIRPSPAERGVPGLGGTGLTSSMFLRSGLPL